MYRVIKAFIFALVLFHSGVVLADDEIPIENRTYIEGDSWVTDFLEKGGDIAEITGLEIPSQGAEDGAKYEAVKLDRPLPARFDWREVVPGGLLPVKSQTCGSCWAESTSQAAALQVVIRNPYSKRFTLSTQTLVSRCSSAGSCSGGYFTALNYIRDVGLPDETQDPYKGRNTSCRDDLSPLVRIKNWFYVGAPGRTATIEEMKAALIKYGPLVVDVNASFGSYRGGIYNNCNTRNTNHMVIITSYDDSNGGYWTVMNSWNSQWGDKGYLKIRYTNSKGQKCNNLGQRTAALISY